MYKKFFFLPFLFLPFLFLQFSVCLDIKGELPHSIQNESLPNEEMPAVIVEFSPPKGWKAAEASSLPKHVKYMVVGQGKKQFPPSINLGVSPYQGSLKNYLKMVKSINDAQGIPWKDLGTIKTEAGMASLSQVDMKTQWGEVKEMHLILIDSGMVYILTAAALKEEFPHFYKDFFQAMRSLRLKPLVMSP